MATSIPATSGGGSASPESAWFSTCITFAQSLISTLVVVPFRTECSNGATALELTAVTATGTGSNTALTASPGGVIENSTGTTAASLQQLTSKGGAANAFISNLRTSKYASFSLFRLVSPLPSTYNGILANATDFVSADTYLGVDSTTSTTNWITQVGSASKADTGVAYDFVWHTGMVIADGTNVNFYLGAQDGTGMTKMGSGGAQSTCPNAAGIWDFYMQGNPAANAAKAHIDAGIVLTERASSSQ